MKTGRFLVLALAGLLAGCDSASRLVTTTTTPAVRKYNGTASVGDFLTISIDPSAQTITYKNYTNGEHGTVPYAVNTDGTYTITDPQGNLLSAYEVPGSALMVEAAHAGPNSDSQALITAIESAPASINTFAGRNFNYIQFRTSTGGIEIGTVTVDGSGNITHASFWPFGVFNPNDMFNSGSFPASAVTEDASGNFFTITEQNSSEDYVFGTQNGLFAVDTGNGTILSQPKASSKDFNATNAGTYKAIYYEKSDAMTGQNNQESGTPSEGKATIVVAPSGTVTVTDSNGNAMATGTLAAIADTPRIYDGTSNTMPDPLWGLFTFRSSTSSLQQDVFVTFQGNAVIFSSFETALPINGYQPYTYFYGVGLK